MILQCDKFESILYFNKFIEAVLEDIVKGYFYENKGDAVSKKRIKKMNNGTEIWTVSGHNPRIVYIAVIKENRSGYIYKLDLDPNSKYQYLCELKGDYEHIDGRLSMCLKLKFCIDPSEIEKNTETKEHCFTID